jgi:hypothetical protein
MSQAFGLLIFIAGILVAAGAPRNFNTVFNIETTSETTANESIGDLDCDG